MVVGFNLQKFTETLVDVPRVMQHFVVGHVSGWLALLTVSFHGFDPLTLVL